MLNRILALLALGWAASAGAFIIPVSYSVVEYVNEGSGHYMLFAGGNPWLDDGGDGGLWTRTGYVFTEYTAFGSSGETRVCRFYSPSHNTHFFTPYAAECNALKQPGSGWVFEGNEFGELPGECSVAVRRLYDGVADHRYSADPGIIAKMLARGWIDEGIGFCAYAAGLAPERSFNSETFDPPRPLAECDAKLGPCVALAQLAPMPTRIPPYVPPVYILPNPDFPAILGIVGVSGQDLYTSRPAGSGDVAQHSFYMNTGGFHVVGSDRIAGPYAGMYAMYQLPASAGATTDERVFPWRNGRERELRITSTLSVTTLTRADPSADAYGLPVIHFADRASGRRFYVTLQAFGTSPGGDYLGTDYSTGWVIVSTSFRENPLFGRRISGNYAQCVPGSPTACVPHTVFSFALSKADFQAALGYARTLDPALSADPADYFVWSFRQHNETYLDATLGMATYQLTLEIWPRVQ